MPEPEKRGRASFWLDEIEQYQKASKPWSDLCKRIIGRYRLESSFDEGAVVRTQPYKPTYNIIWSNTQTIKPAMFSKQPQVVAERRHQDKDPVGRVSAEIIERASNADMERNQLKDTFDKVVLDVLLCARGVPWVRFESEETASDEGEAEVVNERIMVDYVHWDDFAHARERGWGDVVRDGWVGRRTALTLKEGKERFGADFENVNLTLSSRTEQQEGEGDKTDKAGKYAEVWEIWDAVERKQLFLAKGHKKLLESRDDPYKLEQFFPCPKPAYGTLTNEDLIPTPDHAQILDLADELDVLSWRIRKLTEAMRLRGAYDQSAEGLGKLLESAKDGEMIPVQNLAGLLSGGNAQAGGLPIVFVPLGELIQTLLGLYQARQQAKDTLFEISGISDIVRGQVDPREKATQSRIKASYTSQRLDQRRREVERCVRDTCRIVVEMMCELYSPELLREQSGYDFLPEVAELDEGESAIIWEQVIELISQDKARGFRVDIETDSTVEMDAQVEREGRIEFLTAMGSFMEQYIVLLNEAPQLASLGGEIMMFAARGFRAGRTLESSFQQAIDTIQEEQQQAQQQEAQEGPPPDPEAEAAAAREQQKGEIEQVKAQAQIQKVQQDQQVDQAKANVEIEKAVAEYEQMKSEHEVKMATMQTMLDKARLQAAQASQGSAK